VMYADDVLLLSPSVTLLQKLLHVCERELAWLDMSINFSKSCCIGYGLARVVTGLVLLSKASPATVYGLPWTK